MVMKYIENLELREWVKDSLKKTIFQKAHALAIQTGCQILVKLEDDYDPTRHQYYATDKLRKVFKNNGLRQQAGEKFVSGVTGEPLIDQAIQSDAASQDERTNNVVEQGSTCSEVEVTSQGSGPEERLMPEERLDSDNVASGGEEAIPMQLSLTAESFPSETADDGVKTEVTDEDMPTDVQIKVERIDDDPGGGTGSLGGGGDTSSAPMFGGFDPNTTGQSDSSSTQFQSVPPVTPLVQYQSTYQVPMSPKPYQCAMCGKTFRSVQVLQKHTQTFHMKTQHAMMGVRRGRGRPPMKLNRPQPQPRSFTCVMCHITFPDAEILQDHMTRTHMGGGTPQPQETLDDFSALGTSQESAMPSFVIPHTQSSPGDASPAASQASPYSSQSSAPVFPRNVSAAEGKPGTSAGTSRKLYRFLKPNKDVYGQDQSCSITNIMKAILLTAGPVSNATTFLYTGPQYMRRVVTVDQYNEAALKLQEANLGLFITIMIGHGFAREVFIKKTPEEVENLLLANNLCTPEEYAVRYDKPLPSKIKLLMRKRLVELGYFTHEQMFKDWKT